MYILTTAAGEVAGRITTLLGFVPQESLVLDCLGPVGAPDPLLVRLDLADLTAPSQAAVLLDRVLAPLRLARAQAVLVVYYTAGSPALLAPVDQAVDQLLARVALPRAGTVLVDDPGSGPTREKLGRVDPVDPADRRTAVAALARGGGTLSDYRRAVSDAAHGQRLSPTRAGQLAAWLANTQHRDSVIVLLVDSPEMVGEGPVSWQAAGAALAVLLDPGTAQPPGPGVAAHTRVLTQVIAAVPVSHHAPARTLLALIAWWSGHGALADRHLSEALAADPDYRLAWLLQAVVGAGTPPAWTRWAATDR